MPPWILHCPFCNTEFIHSEIAKDLILSLAFRVSKILPTRFQTYQILVCCLALKAEIVPYFPVTGSDDQSNSGLEKPGSPGAGFVRAQAQLPGGAGGIQEDC